MLRGNVWLLLRGVPVIRLPGTDNFLPDAETMPVFNIVLKNGNLQFNII